ncbi:MAG: type I restriction enzyme HsdR N-terminal domain-containing protein [Bacteroidales bacterium]|nr:type I restriction enzyme HsdR N-terminal domain-containing protein [Bacteroidales bacterium]
MKSRRTANIKLRDSEGRREVFDIVRNRFVALTPEEWVRQHVIHYLHEELGYPLELMQVEGAITLNGMTRRCDIVVYDEEVRPLIIVECKNESVALTQKVLDQACRYNLVLQVPYLCLTNGVGRVCCRVDFAEKKVEMIPKLPNYHKKS